MKIKVGSRESALAVKQSELVIDCIKKHHPDIEIELVTMKTTGDIILNKSLDKIGGKGLFVKELDKALKDSVVNITVHSFKDMPMEVDPDLPIVAVSKREDPRDTLVLPSGITDLKDIDWSKPIGCSSARRKLQFEALYPQCTISPIRGNVLSRLDKLDNGEFSAIILAVAGLNRLNLESRASLIFSPDEMLPSACQGIMAVQARKDFDTQFLSCFNDQSAFLISIAERSFVATLNGGCSSPVAAHGTLNGDILTLTGLYVSENGSWSRMTVSGDPNDGVKLGSDLANKMKQQNS